MCILHSVSLLDNYTMGRHARQAEFSWLRRDFSLDGVASPVVSYDGREERCFSITA